MSFIIDLFGSLFGSVMNLLFSLTNSYAVSVLLMVLIMRVAVFPVKRALAKVKKKPKGERDKKTTVLRILKAVFSVLQLFMLFGLYAAITSPVTSILRFDAETVGSLIDILKENGLTRVNELSILNNLAEYREVFSYIITGEQLSILEEFKTHFTLGSIDLTQIPSVDNLSIVVPIISTVLTIFPFVMQLKGTKGGIAKLPLPFKLYFGLIMALTCFIGFVLPVGVGYYLCISKILNQIEAFLTKKLDARAVKGNTEATQIISDNVEVAAVSETNN